MSETVDINFFDQSDQVKLNVGVSLRDTTPPDSAYFDTSEDVENAEEAKDYTICDDPSPICNDQANATVVPDQSIVACNTEKFVATCNNQKISPDCNTRKKIGDLQQSRRTGEKTYIMYMKVNLGVILPFESNSINLLLNLNLKNCVRVIESSHHYSRPSNYGSGMVTRVP